MKRPSKWFYLLAAFLPFAGCGATMFQVLTGLGGRLDGLERAVVPGEVEVDLVAGKSTVFYEQKSRVDGVVYQTGELSGLRCGLTDPQGGQVALENPTGSQTYTMGAYAGSSVFELDTPHAGTHKLACAYPALDDGSDAPGSKVVLAFMPGSLFGGIFTLLLPMIIGLLAGLGTAITVFILRRR